MPNPNAVKDTQNILEAMTREVLDSKPKRGAKLTPVGAEQLVTQSVDERPNPISGVPALFPYDSQIGRAHV